MVDAGCENYGKPSVSAAFVAPDFRDRNGESVNAVYVTFIFLQEESH